MLILHILLRCGDEDYVGRWYDAMMLSVAEAAVTTAIVILVEMLVMMVMSDLCKRNMVYMFQSEKNLISSPSYQNEYYNNNIKRWYNKTKRRWNYLNFEFFTSSLAHSHSHPLHPMPSQPSSVRYPTKSVHSLLLWYVYNNVCIKNIFRVEEEEKNEYKH